MLNEGSTNPRFFKRNSIWQAVCGRAIHIIMYEVVRVSAQIMVMEEKRKPVKFRYLLTVSVHWSRSRKRELAERQRSTEQHFPPGVIPSVASRWTPGLTMRHRRLIRSTTATQIAATKIVAYLWIFSSLGRPSQTIARCFWFEWIGLQLWDRHRSSPLLLSPRFIPALTGRTRQRCLVRALLALLLLLNFPLSWDR